MDNFFEQLFNVVYHEGQSVLTYFFEAGEYRSGSIKFGGFRPSYNWYGKVEVNFDRVGPLETSTKVIYLNICFLHHYLGIISWPRYNFAKFVNSMAHEITHCLLADYDPKQAGEHSPWFYIIAYFIEAYLWETNEIKILARLAGSNQLLTRSLKKQTL